MTLQMEMNLKYNEGKKLGLELGKQRGLNLGMAKARLDLAVIAVKRFNLPVEDVAKEYGVSVEEIRRML
ncbi:MAG: hypothetical protein ACI4LX_06240 [Treponema sp.]